MRVGGVDLLVETTPVTVAGSQPTSRVDEAADAVVGAFDRAEEAVVAVASSLVASVGRLGGPARLEVEFGLKFSAQGSVVVAAVSGEA